MYLEGGHGLCGDAAQEGLWNTTLHVAAGRGPAPPASSADRIGGEGFMASLPRRLVVGTLATAVAAAAPAMGHHPRFASSTC